MQSDKERIELIIQSKKLNNVEFCNKTSMSPSTLSHILSERTKPTLVILRSIVEAFPDLNPMWVLLGEGEMYKSNTQMSEYGDENTETVQGENFVNDLFAPSINGAGNETKGNNGNFQVQPSGGTTLPYSASSASNNSANNIKRNNGNAQMQQQTQYQIQQQLQAQQAIMPNVLSEADIEKIVIATLAQQQKPQRKVTEVRIFFDDGTYECFTSKDS